MRIEHPVRSLLIVLALSTGVALGLLRPSPGATTTITFGDALWRTRQADLLLQLGLMLVGALGVHALLPGEDEEIDHDALD